MKSNEEANIVLIKEKRKKISDNVLNRQIYTQKTVKALTVKETKKKCKNYNDMVRDAGLEPARLTALEVVVFIKSLS